MRDRMPSAETLIWRVMVHATLRSCESGCNLIWACPVQSMGWVETGSCRRYSQSAGDSALASLPQDAHNRGALPSPRSQAASNFLCAQALKVAAQLSCYGGDQQV